MIDNGDDMENIRFYESKDLVRLIDIERNMDIFHQFMTGCIVESFRKGKGLNYFDLLGLAYFKLSEIQLELFIGHEKKHFSDTDFKMLCNGTKTIIRFLQGYNFLV